MTDRMRHKRLYFGPVAILAALALMLACGAGEKEPPASEKIPVYTFKIVKVYPHDKEAFTQGLMYADGVIYEGTGQRGESSIRKVSLETGEVIQKRDLPAELFGEGITLVDDHLIQLTWTSQVGFVYDKNSLQQVAQFRYLTEGWGLTYDGKRLIMSDGTATLQMLDPKTYEYTGYIAVKAGRTPVEHLNELEFVDGEIFANVWPGNRIARIDPETGSVVGWIDGSGLLAPEDYRDTVDVLNGIAWDARSKRLFVTGKLWPKLFEVELVESN